MKFTTVVKGLKEGKVYQLEDWSSEQYLVLNPNGEIKLFDFGKTEHLELKADDVLSNGWKECKKKTLYVLGIHLEHGIFNDNVYTNYRLSEKKEKSYEDYSSWEDTEVSEDTLNEYNRYYTLVLSDDHNLDENEEKELEETLKKVI